MLNGGPGNAIEMSKAILFGSFFLFFFLVKLKCVEGFESVSSSVDFTRL